MLPKPTRLGEKEQRDGPSQGLVAVVALVGRAGAGKSHLARALLAAIPQAEVLSVSTELRAQLAERGRPATRAELAELGQAWIDRSPSALVERVLSRRRPISRVVIVDGVRHESFLGALEVHARPVDTTVLWIQTPLKIRHERLVAEGMDRQAVTELDGHPTERTIERWAPRHASRIVDGTAPVDGVVADLAASLQPSLGLSAAPSLDARTESDP